MINGVAGQQYDIVDGKPVIKEQFLNGLKSDPNYAVKFGVSNSLGNKYNNLIRFNPKVNPQGYPVDFTQTPEVIQQSLTPAQKDFIETYGYKTPTEAFTKVPNYLAETSIIGGLTIDEAGSDLAGKQAEISAYVGANIAKVIFQKSDAEYEKEKSKFLEDITAMGGEEVFNYYLEKFNALNLQTLSQ